MITYGHSSGTASDSICPKGWRLPGYEGSGSYYDLTQIYDNGATDSTAKDLKDTFLQINPLSFLRAGYLSIGDGSVYVRASGGYYWSSRRSSQTNAYLLLFHSGALDPQYDNSRGTGRSVRCLAR